MLKIHDRNIWREFLTVNFAQQALSEYLCMCQLYTVICTVNVSHYELATHSAYTTLR